MFPNETRVSQLIRGGEKPGRTFVQTIAFDPPPHADRRAGRIFGVFTCEAGARVGDALIAHLEDGLASSVREALTKLPPGAGHELVFESAIGRINQRLARVIAEQGFPVNDGSIQAIIVSQLGPETVMAVWGRPSALLFRPGENQPAIYNLLAGLPAGRHGDHGGRAESGVRGFNNVVTGTLSDRDRLLVATTDLRRIFDTAALAETVITQDPITATKTLRDSLPALRRDRTPPFALLIIDSGPTAGAPAAGAILAATAPPRAADPDERRRVPLVPPVAPARTVPSKIPAAALPAPPPDPVRPSPLILWLGRVLTRLGSSIRTAAAVLADTDRRRALGPAVKTALDARCDAAVDRFNAASIYFKILFVAGFAALMVGNALAAATLVQQRYEAAAAAFGEAVFNIEQKLDSAEASSIYRDEARAQALLEEARQDIAALPAESDRQRAEIVRLAALLEKKRDTLRHAVPFADPEVIADIAADQGPVELVRIALGAGQIWSAGRNGAAFKTSLQDGSTVPAAEGGNRAVTLLTTTEGGALAMTETGNVTLLGRGGPTARRITLDEGVTLTDAAVYDGRIYTLDPVRNRITRFAPTAAGYGAAQLYLKDGTDVSNAVALAVDGAIYVLMKDGSVVRLLKGLRTPFDLGPADPPVAAPRRLVAKKDSERLFLLDAAPGRLLVYDKGSGAFLGQYTAPSLAAADDFAVDEAARTLYVAAQNQILKFALPELK